MTLKQRFESKFKVTPGCWEWTASRARGYGKISVGPRGAGFLIASRASYELYVGPVPVDKMALPMSLV